MALSERQTKKVAEEKRRMALAGGASPEKADRYAREVIEYGRQQRKREKNAGGR